MYIDTRYLKKCKWEDAKKHLFEIINYRGEEWSKYDDQDPSILTRLHNIAVGLLLDNKWNTLFIHENLFYLSKILCDNYNFDIYRLGHIEQPFFKYLQHPILQKINYKQFLKSLYWKNVKNLKDEECGNCQLCGKYIDDENIKAHLHHNNYAIHGFEHLKIVRDKFLILLCSACHHNFHKNNSACKGWE